jgi:hypothetical protein
MYTYCIRTCTAERAPQAINYNLIFSKCRLISPLQLHAYAHVHAMAPARSGNTVRTLGLAPGLLPGHGHANAIAIKLIEIEFRKQR